MPLSHYKDCCGFEGYHYLATIIVYGRVWQCSIEYYAIFRCPATDALSQLSGIYQDGPARSGRALVPRPCFREERLALEILVELITHFSLDVFQYPGDYLLHVTVHRHQN